MGKKPKDITGQKFGKLTAINYEPNNCKWILLNEQVKNTRKTRFITINDETLCLSDWAKKLKIKYDKLRYHIDKEPNYIQRLIAS